MADVLRGTVALLLQLVIFPLIVRLADFGFPANDIRVMIDETETPYKLPLLDVAPAPWP